MQSLDKEWLDIAQIILLDLVAGEKKDGYFLDFAKKFRAETGGSIPDAKQYYSAFMGFDGREYPIYDLYNR